MTRRVVFAGGIQARALAKAYRLDIAADRDEDVFFIGAEAMVRDAAHRVIAAADIVITDLTQAGETVPDHLIPTNAERVAVPVVFAPFLWPFAGRPHPRNRGIDALKEGPYPADFGDSFLDSMIEQGVSEEEAIDRYLALNIGREARLDETLERSLAGLAVLDARSGFDMAGFVEREFRRQNLFATTERLRLAMFRAMASAVFSRMGIEDFRAEALLEAHFAPGAMPIHPGVLQHFGMAAPLPDHRYPILDEGTFTFEQFCRRYMRFEWNEKLHVAMALADSSPAEAIPLLRAALDVSPGSRAGQLALEEAERSVAESSGVAPKAIGSGSQEDAPAPLSTTSYTPLYAAVDSPLPDHQATSGLMPGSLPKGPEPAEEPEEAQPPMFAPSGLGGLPFTARGSEADSAPFSKSGQPVRPVSIPDPSEEADWATPESYVSDPVPLDETPVVEADETPEQQPYVELPMYQEYRGAERREQPAPSPAQRTRYEPLPPSAELIEVLPRMLPSTRGLTSTANLPFAQMPETMPPPPLRPVLPPELQPEFDDKRGLVGRLFGGKN